MSEREYVREGQGEKEREKERGGERSFKDVPIIVARNDNEKKAIKSECAPLFLKHSKLHIGCMANLPQGFLPP